MSAAAALRIQIESALSERIPGALSPHIHQQPELFPFSIQQVDELLQGGVPQGGISEISGPASSGKTSLALSLVAAVSQKSLACAWVDVEDQLDPESAAASGICLDQLLWIRTKPNELPATDSSPNEKQRIGSAGLRAHAALRTQLEPLSRFQMQQSKLPWSRLDQALKATDLLLQTGGFSLIVLDMGEVQAEHALRVPLASWYRFRLAAEQAQTALLLLTSTPCAKSCASLVLRCQPAAIEPWTRKQEKPLFSGLRFELIRERKRNPETNIYSKRPAGEAHTNWTGRSPWMR